MSLTTTLKELLAAAETACPLGCPRLIGNPLCPRHVALARLKSLAIPLAQDWLRKEEALTLLLERIDEGHLVATEDTAARQSEGIARAALNPKALTKALEGGGG